MLFRSGLVVVTPGAGFVEPWAALVMGLIVSPVCYFAISHLKTKFGYDDALDAFGCHGIGGILGGVLTGLFCVPELSWTGKGGLFYTGDVSLLISQILGIVVTIVTGSLAGRVKFGAMMAFLGIWLLVVYAPLAHMVWGGEGSFIGDIIGALDFAGGDVVHISSGLTGLILCLMLGRRRGFGMVSYRPHNVPFVALGAGLLWFG